MLFLLDILHELTVSEKDQLTYQKQSLSAQQMQSCSKKSTARNSVQCDLNTPLKCGPWAYSFLWIRKTRWAWSWNRAETLIVLFALYLILMTSKCTSLYFCSTKKRIISSACDPLSFKYMHRLFSSLWGHRDTPSTNRLLEFGLGFGSRGTVPVKSPSTQVDVGRLQFLTGCWLKASMFPTWVPLHKAARNLAVCFCQRKW